MDDYDYEKIDREMERKTTEELGYVREYDRWIEPEHEDIEIAKVQRFVEIGNFGKDDTSSILPDWNPVIELLDSRPPKFEWVCVGEYNGVDIPGTEIDADYKVWQVLSNPEYSCEVIIDC